jgi:hypothetical protein
MVENPQEKWNLVLVTKRLDNSISYHYCHFNRCRPTGHHIQSYFVAKSAVVVAIMFNLSMTNTGKVESPFILTRS